MRLLLDTNILIAITHRRLAELSKAFSSVVHAKENSAFASAASIWEIAIKTRLGKLDPLLPLDKVPAYFQSVGIDLLVVDHRHAVAPVHPEPATRDPFDRLLPAQCQVEGLRLVTRDRVLAAHPLAWRPV